MKNIGLSIEYSEGKSTILNIPDTKIYTAGEILCDLMAGNSLYILLRKVRVYPFCFPDGDDPITLKAESSVLFLFYAIYKLNSTIEADRLSTGFYDKVLSEWILSIFKAILKIK